MGIFSGALRRPGAIRGGWSAGRLLPEGRRRHGTAFRPARPRDQGSGRGFAGRPRHAASGVRASAKVGFRRVLVPDQTHNSPDGSRRHGADRGRHPIPDPRVADHRGRPGPRRRDRYRSGSTRHSGTARIGSTGELAGPVRPRARPHGVFFGNARRMLFRLYSSSLQSGGRSWRRWRTNSVFRLPTLRRSSACFARRSAGL
jgi:hypothetical protein